MNLYDKMWLCAIGFALVYYVGVRERENRISGEKLFQSNIYQYANIEGVLCISGKDVPRRTKKNWRFCQTNQDPCACTRFLCMHNSLVHAQHSCACTGGATAQGPDPKRALGVRPGPALFLGPGLGPWPLQCMHKSVVHAQECCACTRILCMHKDLDIFDKFLTQEISCVDTIYFFILTK